MTVDAVVLAGGRNSPEMEAATGTDRRALTLLGDRTMLSYVIGALRRSEAVGEIYVVGGVPPGEGYRTVGGGETLLDNLMAGLDAAGATGQGERALVSTSDIPFLTPEGVDDFVRRAAASGADLCCPFVAAALCRAQFPEMKRTAIKLREGQFTLGNLMLVNARFVRAHRGTIEQAYAARKSPMQMARLLGPGLLLRLLLAQTVAPQALTVGALEASVSRLLGDGARAVGLQTAFAEIGTDVDKPEDVAVARRLLAPGDRPHLP